MKHLFTLLIVINYCVTSFCQPEGVNPPSVDVDMGERWTGSFIEGAQMNNSAEPCVGGAMFCPECEDVMADGCFMCDVEGLDGYLSCTPEYVVGGTQPDQPSPLCYGTGLPQNMSWFAFAAGSPDLCVTITLISIPPGTDGIGLQSGIYDFCEDEGGVCVGGDVDCTNGYNPFTYEVNDLVVGNIYYLFVDGCNGMEANYEISIDKGVKFELDTPDEVTVEASCDQSPLLPMYTYCPETVLQFNITHLGDSPGDNGEFDAPGSIYNPEMDATFHWTFDPPIEGMDGGEWNQSEDGYNIPPLDFSFVTEPTDFEICLTDIITECDDKSCSDCCIDITIEPLPNEFFGPYDVCFEDLLPPGWDPAQVGDDPNGDGLGWLGPNNITIGQIENEADGILEYEVFDPNCNCMFTQSIQINDIGNRDPTPVTLYMYDCQFRDEDNDPEEYEWIWPDEELELYGDEFEEFFQIEMASLEIDWHGDQCHSLILLTVDTVTVGGELFGGPCTPVGTQYWFELNLDELALTHPEHPSIFPNYMVEWVNDSGIVVQNDTITIAPGEEGPYTVFVEYCFFDGAYGEAAGVIACCTKEFGPFDLETGIAEPPDFLRLDTVFCENDLVGKLFVINPFMGSTYDWTFPAGADGVVLNAPVGDTAVVDFTDYDFSLNAPIQVLANTSCGPSPTLEIFVRTDSLPVPAIDAPDQVCVDQIATAIFAGDQSEISTYSWSSEYYINGNQSGPGPVIYGSSSAGSFDIELVVVDSNGCESIPVIHTVDVIPDLEVPILDCSTTASSVSFIWNDVEGATGYTINVLQSPMGTDTLMNSAGDTSVIFDGLNVLDEIQIEVIANGDPPCGDSEAEILGCQALDCPNPLWVFNLWFDTSYCENDPIEPFSFDVGANDDGVATFAGNGVSPTGLFDPLSPDVVVGINTITMSYTYQNGNCVRTRTIEVEVFPTPSAEFLVSDNEICLGEFITIDDSNVDEVANWNGYGGGSINSLGHVSWDTSGLKTITLDVIAPNNMGNCTVQNTVNIMVLDTVIMGPVSCVAHDSDFVEFDWADAFSTTGYEIEYSINGVPVDTTTINESEIVIDGLMTGDEVDITVTALSANACPDVPSSATCFAVECVPLMSPAIICSNDGADFIEFEWEMVNGASSFEVYIDGVLIGTQTATTYRMVGLSPGDIIVIEVVAINDDLLCPNASGSAICEVEEGPIIIHELGDVELPLVIHGPQQMLVEETGTFSFSLTADNIDNIIWRVNGEIVCRGLDCNTLTIVGSDYPHDFDLQVQVYFNEDCFIESSMRVDVFDNKRWYIPNVITTKGSDPVNSQWQMFTKGEGILVKNVKIYDRRGELIHDRVINSTASTVDLFWGASDGGPAIQGVYVYLIEMEVEGRQIVEAGDVTILR